MGKGWAHGGFLLQADPQGIWQDISNWVAPGPKRLRRVKSEPYIRGKFFASWSFCPVRQGKWPIRRLVGLKEKEENTVARASGGRFPAQSLPALPCFAV